MEILAKHSTRARYLSQSCRLLGSPNTHMEQQLLLPSPIAPTRPIQGERRRASWHQESLDQSPTTSGSAANTPPQSPKLARIPIRSREDSRRSSRQSSLDWINEVDFEVQTTTGTHSHGSARKPSQDPIESIENELEAGLPVFRHSVLQHSEGQTVSEVLKHSTSTTSSRIGSRRPSLDLVPSPDSVCSDPTTLRPYDPAYEDA